MIDYSQLYASWILSGSYFNAMLHCGPKYNGWVEDALHYVPPDILWEHRDKLAFIGTGAMDACRVSPTLSKDREIIVLSERIFPKGGAKSEDDPKARYLIFVVLHEVAHAVKKHRSPLLDNLTEEEDEDQEKEANKLAFEWFNTHVKARNNISLKPINPDEIAAAKAESSKLMEKAYEED